MVEVEDEGLQDALERQVALQREADHRIKNNLQLISSLLLLQSRRTTDEPAKQALRATLQRVTAVSAAHRNVVRAGETEWVEAAALVRELVSDLAASAGRDDLSIDVGLDALMVPARHAAPLALVANELVSNALRHGFPEARAGAIRVELTREPRRFRFVVADDGVGCEADQLKGFGMTVVQLLAQQLRGACEIDAQPGVRVVVTVPIDWDPPQH